MMAARHDALSELPIRGSPEPRSGDSRDKPASPLRAPVDLRLHQPRDEAFLSLVRMMVAILVGCGFGAATGFTLAIVPLGLEYWDRVECLSGFAIAAALGGAFATVLSARWRFWHAPLMFVAGAVIGGGLGGIAAALAWTLSSPLLFRMAIVLFGGGLGAWLGRPRSATVQGGVIGAILFTFLTLADLYLGNVDGCVALGALVGTLCGLLVCWSRAVPRVLLVGRCLGVCLLMGGSAVLAIIRERDWPTTQYAILTDDYGVDCSCEIVVSPDGQGAISSHYNSIVHWSVNDGHISQLAKFEKHSPATLLCFPSGSNGCYVERDGVGIGRRCLIGSGRLLDRFSSLSTNVRQPDRDCIAVASDGTWVVAVRIYEQRIVVWDFEKRSGFDVPFFGDTPSIACGKGRYEILLASHPYLDICHIENKNLKIVHRCDLIGRYSKLVVSPDGRYVCAYSSFTPFFQFMDRDNDKELRKIGSVYGSPIRHLAVTASGERVLTLHEDGTMRLWHPATGEELRCYRQNQSWLLSELTRDTAIADSIAITADGKVGLFSSRRGLVGAWRLD